MTGWRLILEAGQEIAEPSWDQVRGALQSLDGESWTELSLHLVGVGTLMVGGGNGGRYIVGFASEELGWFPTLADPSRGGEPPVEFVAGGQVGDYPAWLAVGIRLAEEALRHFFERRKLAAHLTWVDFRGQAGDPFHQGLVLTAARPFGGDRPEPFGGAAAGEQVRQLLS